MKFYDCGTRTVVDLTVDQWNFLNGMVELAGDLGAVRVKYPMSDMLLAQFQQDKTFWPMVETATTIAVRGRRLDPDYLKDYMLATLEGSQPRTKAQSQAINSTIRLLYGQQSTNSGKVVIQPNRIEVTFIDGELPIDGPGTHPGAISGPNRPIPIDLDNSGQGEAK